MNETRYLEIIEQATYKVIHRVDVTSKTESQINRVERGLLMKIDAAFFVRDTSTESQPVQP